MPVLIEDRGTVHEIDGKVIGEAGTNPSKLRWMQITLYRLASGGLLLHRVGYSKVYHDNTGRCRTLQGRVSGSPATVEDLPDDAEPCEKCQPAEPEYLGDSESIKFEFPRHTFDSCDTAQDVEDKLAPRDGKEMSEPSQNVLDQAARNDPEFAALPRRRVRY